MPLSVPPGLPWNQVLPALSGNQIPHIPRRNVLPAYPETALNEYSSHCTSRYNPDGISRLAYSRQNYQYKTSCQAYRSFYTSPDAAHGLCPKPLILRSSRNKTVPYCRTVPQTWNHCHIIPYTANAVHPDASQNALCKFSLPGQPVPRRLSFFPP